MINFTAKIFIFLFFLGGSVSTSEACQIINLSEIAQELTNQNPSASLFWDHLGKLVENDDQDMLNFVPEDKRFNEISVILDRNKTKSVESVKFILDHKMSHITIKDLGKIFSEGEPAVIGPSNPGFRYFLFGTIKTPSSSFEITILGKVDTYKLNSDLKIAEIIFRRDKVD